MSRQYILNQLGEPVPEPDLSKWGKWMGQNFEDSLRRVKRETIGDCDVSTVFLGLDHNYGVGPPILWETMVFGGKMDQEQARCSGSREQAEAMHAKMVRLVKEKQNERNKL